MLFWALYKSVSDGINPNPEDADRVWLGHFSAPVIIGVGFFLLGFVLMLAMWPTTSTFFRRRPEVAPPGFLDRVAPEPMADSVTALRQSQAGAHPACVAGRACYDRRARRGAPESLPHGARLVSSRKGAESVCRRSWWSTTCSSP